MSTATSPEPFVHPALFYEGTEQYIAGTVPFLREGLDAGEPAAVAAPPDRLELIREGLGERAAAQVRFIDMTRAGRNPGRIIPGVLRKFADAQPGARRVRIIGEPIWQGRSADEYPACVQHEALINAAFTGRAVTILCPYDAGQLRKQALSDALATHPVVIDADGQTSSTAYGPEEIIARYNEPLLAPSDAAVCAFAARTTARHPRLRRVPGAVNGHVRREPGRPGTRGGGVDHQQRRPRRRLGDTADLGRERPGRLRGARRRTADRSAGRAPPAESHAARRPWTPARPPTRRPRPCPHRPRRHHHSLLPPQLTAIRWRTRPTQRRCRCGKTG